MLAMKSSTKRSAGGANRTGTSRFEPAAPPPPLIKSYYTVEYSEERVIPDIEGVDIEMERKILWDVVNNECDAQSEEIMKTFKY